MPKKTKELETTEKAEKKTAKKTTKAASKKVATKKATTTKKKETAKKKTTTPKTSEKKVATKKTTKKPTVKKTATKTATKKTEVKEKKTTTKKVAAKKTTTKKSATSKAKKTTKATKKVEFKTEYYDLPYLYNKTVVKVLAQTPKMLFIYWEVNEQDRNNLLRNYGENFFNITKPVLIVYNDTLNYSFEVEINDFANSWYLHIDDPNCEYHVELGRKPFVNTYNQENQTYIPYYIYLTTSNEMSSPNNKIMFDPFLKSIKFRNVKTGETFERDINEFTFITNLGIFKLQDLYKKLYPNENFETQNVFIGNPSSGLTTSGMFSSQFK